MGINLSEGSVSTQESARLRAGFVLVLGGLLTGLRRIFLPYLLLCLGVFTLAGYALYQATVVPLSLSGGFAFLGVLLIAVLYGVLAVSYAAILSVVYAVRVAAMYTADFFYEVFENLQEKVRTHVQLMEKGIAKQQAKIILNDSICEVFAPLKSVRFGSVPVVLVSVLLKLIVFISRLVFLARLSKMSGAVVHMSDVFAARATLAGALFLNMRWLATLILWGLYSIGFIIVVVNLWIIW